MDNKKIKFIPPKNDRMFKAVFTKNISCLKELVSSLTEIPLENMSDLKIMNPELPVTNKDSKMPRLDMYLKVNNKLVNIEIQLCEEKDFINRSLYYWARMYTEKTKIGKEYELIPQTICINILDYKNLDPDNSVKLWLQFLKVESRKELEMVKESGNTAIAEAADAVNDINVEWDEALYEIQMEKIWRDEQIALNRAREEERQEWINKINNSGLPQEEIDKLLS